MDIGDPVFVPNSMIAVGLVSYIPTGIYHGKPIIIKNMIDSCSLVEQTICIEEAKWNSTIHNLPLGIQEKDSHVFL